MTRAPIAAIILLLLAVPAAAQQGALDRTIDRAGANVLEIDAGGPLMTLTPMAGADAVHVRVDQSGDLPKPQLQSSRSGNRLALSIVPPRGAPILPFVPAVNVKYDITYPASMRVDLRASSGNVRIVKPTSAIEIFDQVGNVTIEEPRAAVTVESARGDIAVRGALAPIDLAADDGNVTASLASGWSGNEIRIQSGSGTIQLTVPASFRARFDASTNQGSVRNALADSGVRTPFVWLYALKGDITVAIGKP